MSLSPLLLLEVHEVTHFITEIEERLDLEIDFFNRPRSEGLVLRFNYSNLPLPRYLGESHSKLEYEKLVSKIPKETFVEVGELPRPKCSDRLFGAYLEMMDAAVLATSRKNKSVKEKKQKLRLQNKIGRLYFVTWSRSDGN